MKRFVINELEDIDGVASEFIAFAGEKKVIAFFGDMGAGKTTFIKAICEALGVEDVINSPTFSIVNEYRSATSGETVYHFDFYRIQNLKEAYNIDVEEYFYSGALCLIEWPEKIREILPEDALLVNIAEQADKSRLITLLSALSD
jgi:tRNA threonylcarbamoyladenosine biosynthesis protein TsaE